MTLRKRALAVVGVSVLSIAAAAQAASVDPLLFQELHWRSVGPFRGGRVLAVDGVPRRAEALLLRRGQRRRVGDRRCRPHLAADLRFGQCRLDRRDRGGAVESADVIYVGTGEADMRSDIAQGNGMYKSTDGGQTLDAHRPHRLAADRHASWSIRAIPTSCSSRRSAIPTARTPSAACSARRTAARPGSTCSVQERRHRRDRPRVRAGQPERHLRRAVADAAPAVERLSAVERAGQRPLQVDRRRRALDAAHRPRLAGEAGPHRPRRRAVRSRSASTRSSTRRRTGRPVSLRRRAARRWTHGQRRRAHLGARLVLRRHHRRSEECRRRLRLQHRSRLPLGRRRQDTSSRSRARRAATTIHQLWIDPRAPRAAHPRRRPGRGGHAQRRRDVELAGSTSRPASSTTSSPTTASRTGSTARSRTPAPRRAEPQRQHDRRDHHDAIPRDHRRRRERQHRARSERSGRRLSAAGSTGSTCARADAVASIRRSPIPTTYRGDLDAAARLLAARSTRSISATSGSSAPTTAASTGRSISPDLTREDPGIPADARSGRPRRTRADRARAAA